MLNAHSTPPIRLFGSRADVSFASRSPYLFGYWYVLSFYVLLFADVAYPKSLNDTQSLGMYFLPRRQIFLLTILFSQLPML